MGSVPFGLLVGKLKGVDIRTLGSMNIGATNVGRVLGKRYFHLVFWLDVLKSFIPTAVAGWLLNQQAETPLTALHYALWVAVAAAALTGHLFSIFLGFKGGKGVASGFGLLMGIFPYLAVSGLLGFVVFITVFWLSRYISLASVMGAAALPLIFAGLGLWRGWDIFGAMWPMLVFVVIYSGMVVYKHKANIRRLLAGTENKWGTRVAV